MERETAGYRWRPARPAPAHCAPSHAHGGGGIDESARRLSHEELAVAAKLAADGHRVLSLPEGRGRGRTADLEVCGRPVEVKSWRAIEDRHGRAPTARSVLNKLIDGRRQADTVVLNGRGSGLTAATARGGVALYAARPDGGQLSAIRVIGDGFDLAWSRQRYLAVASDRPARVATEVRARRMELGLGW